MKEIYYLEACNNYCFVYYKDGQRKLISKCLKQVLLQMNLEKFVRVHSKYAINPVFITSFDLKKSRVHLDNGTQLPISRAQKRILKQFENKAKPLSA